MHVPAWPVYPEQNSAAIAQAFRSTTLSGLGCDAMGSGEDCDGIGAGGSPAGDSEASGGDWAAAAAAAAKAAADLAKLAIIQPGTMQQGNLTSRQNPGYPVQPAVTSSTLLGVQSNTGGALMIAAVVAIGAVVLMSGRKG